MIMTEVVELADFYYFFKIFNLFYHESLYQALTGAIHSLMITRNF